MNASLADLTGRVKELSRESALQCQQMGVMQDTVSYLSACVQQAGHHSPSSGIASEGDSPSLQDNQTGTRPYLPYHISSVSDPDLIRPVVQVQIVSYHTSTLFFSCFEGRYVDFDTTTVTRFADLDPERIQN